MEDIHVHVYVHHTNVCDMCEVMVYGDYLTFCKLVQIYPYRSKWRHSILHMQNIFYSTLITHYVISILAMSSNSFCLHSNEAWNGSVLLQGIYQHLRAVLKRLLFLYSKQIAPKTNEPFGSSLWIQKVYTYCTYVYMEQFTTKCCDPNTIKWDSFRENCPTVKML